MPPPPGPPPSPSPPLLSSPAPQPTLSLPTGDRRAPQYPAPPDPLLYRRRRLPGKTPGSVGGGGDAPTRASGGGARESHGRWQCSLVRRWFRRRRGSLGCAAPGGELVMASPIGGEAAPGGALPAQIWALWAPSGSRWAGEVARAEHGWGGGACPATSRRGLHEHGLGGSVLGPARWARYAPRRHVRTGTAGGGGGSLLRVQYLGIPRFWDPPWSCWLRFVARG
jgi:hypothetical protein